MGSSGGSGGGGAVAQIQQITIAASGTSAIFANIPQTYSDLILTWAGSINTTSAGTTYSLGMWFNSDTTSGHYEWCNITSADGSLGTGGTYGDNNLRIGVAPSSATGYYGGGEILIPGYRQTVLNKVASSRGYASVLGSTGLVNFHYAGGWLSTAAVNHVELNNYGNGWLAGSQFTLWGRT